MHRSLSDSRGLRHRSVAVACLAGFLAAVIGLPVVQPSVGPNGKDHSRPFPCMHGNCGCQSAEACWRGCCCLTNREKLAWAKANGVTPPGYVAAQADKEPPAGRASSSCCQADASAGSCCSANLNCAHADGACAGLLEDSTWSWEFVPAVSSRKCQGLAQFWTILSAAAPVSQRFVWRPSEYVTSEICLTIPTAVSFHLAPDTPPPRA